jgi:hypothetical protein
MANNRTEQAIPTLIDDWTDAICKGDIDRVWQTEQMTSSCTTCRSQSR